MLWCGAMARHLPCSFGTDQGSPDPLQAGHAGFELLCRGWEDDLIQRGYSSATTIDALMLWLYED